MNKVDLKPKILKLDVKLELINPANGFEFIHYTAITKDKAPELFNDICNAVSMEMNRQTEEVLGPNRSDKARLDWFEANYTEDRDSLESMLRQAELLHDISPDKVFTACEALNVGVHIRKSLSDEINVIASMIRMGVEASKAGEFLKEALKTKTNPLDADEEKGDPTINLYRGRPFMSDQYVYGSYRYDAGHFIVRSKDESKLLDPDVFRVSPQSVSKFVKGEWVSWSELHT